MAKTLYDKIWDAHLVDATAGRDPRASISTAIWSMKSPAPRPLKACA